MVVERAARPSLRGRDRRVETPDYPARVTTYTLRSANPAKTRCDAVVVGVVQTSKGPEIADGGSEVASAYGRKLRPLLSSLGVTGKAGELLKVPTSGAISTPLLVLVGLGKKADASAVRRAAGVAARSVTNAASVAIALPADTPELVRAVTEGHLLGGYTYTAYKSNQAKKDSADKPGEVVVLSSVARRKETISAFEEAQLVARAIATTRDWVNTPPGDLTPPAFADAVAEATKELTKGRGAPKVAIKVYDEVQLAELGCGGILGVGAGSSAPPRLVELTYAPKDAKVPPGAGRQGHHLRLRRPDHQAGPEHERDEVRHGRRRRGRAGDVRDRLARAPDQGQHVRADGREHGLRLGDPSRRRALDVRRHHRRDQQHRRRGSPGARRRSRPCHRAEARRDPRRRHPDRPHGRRPRRPGLRRDGLARGRRRRARRGRRRRRGDVADADPRGDDRADPQQQDRRPLPARLGALGRRALRRGVPA